ncbi:MAG: hydantoinase/oxoprolinase family protein [Deltaproteobacteria bacterium]|nr:hydantoinase/oxoprolinase family protein [Deltaproteobacteria bacterium]
MYRICIDVGGTFTDCLTLDETGDLQEFKSPTTPQDPSVGFLTCLSKAARHYDQPLASFLANVQLLIHGTTLATNTLINENGAKTRDLRLEVEERTLYNGEILTALNEAELQQAIARLKENAVQSVAICFLHSYANPAHEQRAAEICKASFNGAYVTASHDILPVWREHERFSTTVVSAYVGPVVERYLRALEKRLRESGFYGNLLMMLSSGLVESLEHCIPRAVYLIGSGPAAAPAGALYLGSALDHQSLLSIDMGGTSFDVCLIRQGEIPTTTESWIGDERVAIKLVDIHSAGAGGGSIAWIDSLGLLRVGPQSAGAEPGPACYGKGGERPTVTDVDVTLGYVPADYFLGGEIPLDTQRAAEAIQSVAAPLNMSIPQAAQAIFTTVNSFMADQITEVSTRRGYDVRDFTLVVGGGAGPIHAAFIADLLGIPTVVVPSVAAAYSAFGMFAMDIGRNFARSYFSRAEHIDLDRLNRLFAEMEQEALESFRSMDVRPDQVVFYRTADMRYIGQFHEVEVEMATGKLSRRETEAALEKFHERHEELYTFKMPWRGVEFLNFRLRAVAPKAPFHLRDLPHGSADASAALKRRRSCWFNGEKVETPVYDGNRLRAGNQFHGPAVIEESTTTVVIPASFACSVDRWKNYVLSRSSQT